MNEINGTVGLALGALALFLLAVAFARRSRARTRAKASRIQPSVVAGLEAGELRGAGASGAEPQLRLVEQRLDDIEARIEAQAAEGSPEDRLQAMASSLVGLIKDKNAQIETALAGLEQMRARLRTLEQVGDLAETRGLFERLETRIDEQKSSQAAQLAALGERIASLRQPEDEGASQAALAEQFSRLYAQKDASLASVMERFTPLEERLAGIEATRSAEQWGAPETLARLETQVEVLYAAREAGESSLAILKAEIAAGMGPVTEIAGRLGDLHAQKDALVETLLRRITALEEDQAAQNPRAALDLLSERLEMVQSRLNMLETPGASPFADVSEQLTRLYAQKDTAVEAVLSRLAPLEDRLAGVEESVASRDPRAVLDRFAERLEAVSAAREQAEATLRERLNLLESPGDNPFADISEQLTRLYAQKDATIETVFARIVPLEQRLGAIERGIATLDPQLALNRFAERLEAVQSRVSLLEQPGESPFTEISEQLTRLYAQKDATVETVFARLAPLEIRLAGIEETIATQDPRPLLDRFAERLEAVQTARAEAEATLRDRIAALEHPGANPFADISEQLTRLYAQKDATVETVFARLAPLEARLDGIEEVIATQDPRAALDRFAERLEAAQTARAEAEATLRDRIAALEHPGTSPFAEISDQLTRLYAQKDATVETVFARLAPLEVRLAGIEEVIATQDPRAALDRFAERLEAAQGRIAALEQPGPSPFTEISEQLTRLYAQKDATVETVFARLAPLEVRLAGIEEVIATQDPRAALDRFAERLDAVQGRVTLLEIPEDNPFAEISDQLTRLYAQKDATVEMVFARLAPLEDRLAELELGFSERDPQAMLAAFAERLEAAQAAHARIEASLRDRISLLEQPGPSPFTEISEQLTRLYAQKDATVETVFARLAPLETRLAELEMGFAERDPQEALDHFALRLEAAQGRITLLETPGPSPFTEISEQLTRLYAQKDATVETVFNRLAPLEARLAELEMGFAERDPAEALDRFAERLEALRTRVSTLELPGSSPLLEISEQLTQLYAQKDATLETMSSRLAPLEVRLDEMEEALRAQDTRAALDRFAERLESAQGRISLLENPGDNPFAEISDQLTRLYAQKDATIETVFARLSPLEARLGELEQGFQERDPQALLAAFAERLEAVSAARLDAETSLRDRIAALEHPGDNPFAEISDQLTRLYAQKDATVETVFARLSPLEARLGELESNLAAQDPRTALYRFAERLEMFQGRLSVLELSDQNPFSEISDQLMKLFAQKDATVEMVFARLAPLEAKLVELEAGWVERDPKAILDAFAERLEAAQAVRIEVEASLRDRIAALETPGENPFTEISAQLTQLYAQKDVTLETVTARLAPLEARLTRVETGIVSALPRLAALEKDDAASALEELSQRMEARLAELEAQTSEADTEEALAEARAIAAQIGARAAAEHTELFANRLALLEASLPRLTAAQARMTRVLERQTGKPLMTGREGGPEPEAGQPAAEEPRHQSEAVAPPPPQRAEMETFPDLPRVVSLHHK